MSNDEKEKEKLRPLPNFFYHPMVAFVLGYIIGVVMGVSK